MKSARIKIRRLDPTNIELSPLTQQIRKVAKYIELNYNGNVQQYLSAARKARTQRVAKDRAAASEGREAVLAERN